MKRCGGGGTCKKHPPFFQQVKQARCNFPESLIARPEKLPKPNRKGLSSNWHFSGANSLLNFRGVSLGMFLKCLR